MKLDRADWDEDGDVGYNGVGFRDWDEDFWADGIYPHIYRTKFGSTRQPSVHPFYLVRAKH